MKADIMFFMSDYQKVEKNSNISLSLETKAKPLEQNSNFCPKCGAKVNPDADICESCGTWLLDGKCKFCYAEMEPDAKFCHECGNPRDGIHCPHCGSLSIFDFCPTCGSPLTEGAQEILELVKNDPDAMAVIRTAINIGSESAKLDTPPQKSNPPIDAQKEAKRIAKELQKEKKQAEADAKKEVLRIAKGLTETKKQAEIDAETAKKAELGKKKQEAITAAAQQKLQNKQFSNSQEARRFHNAVKPKNVKGWRCNAYNVLHTDGPNGCAAPNRGGHWE